MEHLLHAYSIRTAAGVNTGPMTLGRCVPSKPATMQGILVGGLLKWMKMGTVPTSREMKHVVLHNAMRLVMVQ